MKTVHAAMAASILLACAMASAQQASKSWIRGERFADVPRREAPVRRGSAADPDEVVAIVIDRVSADEQHACEIVKEVIRKHDADPELVARIVEAAAMMAPAQMRLVAQCALATAPDSLAAVQEVMANLDPGSGGNPMGAKGVLPKGGLPKGGMEMPMVTPPRAWDILDFEPVVEVIQTSRVSWFRYARVLRESGGAAESGNIVGPKAGMGAKAGMKDDSKKAISTRRPNVVFILADDLGYGDLGCYGQMKIRTPNLDRLARRGLRLSHHYTGAAADEGARSVLWTGQHLGRVSEAGGRQHQPAKKTDTLAGLFAEAGYRTAIIGRWGLVPVNADTLPEAWGWDEFFGYDMRVPTRSYYPSHLMNDNLRVAVNGHPVPGHAKKFRGHVDAGEWISGGYAPDLIVDEAVEFIEENRGKPFLLHLSLCEPHAPLHPPQDWVDQYPEEWDEKPYRGDNGYLPHPRPRAAYAALVSDLDRHVGDVLGALSRSGVSEHTIVVFASDGGAAARGNPASDFHIGGVDVEFFNSGGGLNGSQGSLAEGGIRVPAIVKLPGHVRAGELEETPGYFADWLPTLCAAAGIEAPRRLDGANLWPVLCGGEALERSRPMVWINPRHGGQAAVLSGNFKAIRTGIHTGEPGGWKVYDVVNDPGETVDIAAKMDDVVAGARLVLAKEVAPRPGFEMAGLQ